MKDLILAEKPTVAVNIAKAVGMTSRKDGYFENSQYVITFAVGHLLELYDVKDYHPEYGEKWEISHYPFVPDTFKYKIAESTRKQFKIVKDLILSDEIQEIISATDNDREGQLIADLIFRYLGVKKPIRRLITNEWTTDAIRYGLKNTVPNKSKQSLFYAGLVRQQMDWLLGINLTSVATLKLLKNGTGKDTLHIGRVILPTLKLVYDREMNVKNFKSIPIYYLNAYVKDVSGEEIIFRYIEGDEKIYKFDHDSHLVQILRLINTETAVVVGYECSEKKMNPQRLFSLPTLQGHITTKYEGWSSDKVLKIAQKLYENKLITYPRTDSVYLDETLKENMSMVLNIHKIESQYAEMLQFKDTKRIFNSEKVESHSAITITKEKPRGLSQDEHIVYEAIRNRFLEQFMPLAIDEEIEVTLAFEGKVPSEDGAFLFSAKSIVERSPGWRLIENRNATKKETLLTRMRENESVTIDRVMVNKGETKPNPLHTEETLIKAMLQCGKKYKTEDELETSILSGFTIGASSSRAAVIKKLFDSDYVIKKGKSLVTTDRGKSLIQAFPVKSLFNVETTGKMEMRLKDIEEGKADPRAYLEDVKIKTKEYVQMILETEQFVLNAGEDISIKELRCPKCGKPLHKTKSGVGCTGYEKEGNGCDFFIANPFAGKTLSNRQIALLVINKKTPIIRGFKSKKDTKFDAMLVLNHQYEIKFEFQKSETDLACPLCGKPLKRNKAGMGCSGWKEGCKFMIFNPYCGKRLSDNQIEQLIKRGHTGEIKGFKKKSGNGTFSAILYLDDSDQYKVKMKFE